MRKPYLTNYMEETDLVENNYSYYDRVSQLSYTDSLKETKIIDKIRFGSTRETRAIENSDSDELLMCSGTKHTFTKEDGDPDEIFYSSRTTLTETKEDSDPDELLHFGSTRITKTIEESDPDEFMFT
jgi:hypothetical protein